MIFQAIALPMLILLGLASISLIIFSDWKIRLGLLAVLYLCELIFVSLNWPVNLAVTKLIAGWMVAAVLGMAMISIPEPSVGSRARPSSRLALKISSSRSLHIDPTTFFYLFSAILVGLFAFSISSVLKNWFPETQDTVIWAGLLLIGMGILQLGFRVDVFSTILGLLTMVAGFEIIYAIIERSTLVAGLLAGITLGLGLTGAYLILSPHIEESE